jgi:acyl-CoA thioesterase I
VPQPHPRFVRPRLSARRRALYVLLMGVALALAACESGTGSAATAPPTATPPPTPSPTAVPPVVYVALGASDAVGVGADDPNTQGYVPLLIAKLPRGSEALNLGISGIELHGALTSELPQALSDHPTLVTVWLAANDFTDCAPIQQYEADLDALLAQLQTQTKAHVFVANLPDMSLLPAVQNGAFGDKPCLAGESTSQIRAQVKQWNQVIAAAVTRHHDVLVDLFNSDLASHPELIYRDGFHPSTAGYARLAALFWAQIQAHGGVPQA